MNEYKVGDIITGKVTGIEKYGIFLSVNSEISGLIHISEISQSFVRNVSDYAEIDEEIKARVIGIDSSGKRLKLSVKDLNYRDESKYGNRIVETSSGFSNLEKALAGWIDCKLEEINEKK